MQSFQCLDCKHYQGASLDGSHCKAFPEGERPIPEQIITGMFDHKKKFKGDNGVRYEPVKNPVFPGDDG
tara:strand:+ start:69 stop:275 length:207 start_codon:yes stop_codon:yes gene_type:complete